MSAWTRIGVVGLSVAWFGLIGWLAVVDLRGWARTRALRSGRPPPPPEPSRSRSSPTTWLAASAGVVAGAWGAVVASAGRPAGAVVAAAGAAIAATGARARVTGITIGDDRLVVRYATRPAFVIAWADVQELRPPRWPVGGWAVVHRTGARRMLMPSDVLGQERALESLVGFAGLRFESRAWVRGP